MSSYTFMYAFTIASVPNFLSTVRRASDSWRLHSSERKRRLFTLPYDLSLESGAGTRMAVDARYPAVEIQVVGHHDI
jgi:hypothetical protein